MQHCYALGGNTSNSVRASAESDKQSKIPPVAVAVKIMRPGVRDAMEFDLRMMLLVASALQYLPAFGFVAIKNSVEEFATAMRRQLDFSIEETHLKRFRDNFGLPSPSVPADLLPLHNKQRHVSEVKPACISSDEINSQRQHACMLRSLPLKLLGMRRQVTFPYTFEALNSSDVLVMTLEAGFTLNQLFKTRKQLQEAEQQSPLRKNIHNQKPPAQAGGCIEPYRDNEAPFLSSAISIIERFNNVGMICLHSFLQMVFLDNFFHGDMHSGNLLCRFARDRKQLVFPVVPATSASWGTPEACSPDGPLELVVLDCGLAGSLTEADRVNFVLLLDAIGKKTRKGSSHGHAAEGSAECVQGPGRILSGCRETY